MRIDGITLASGIIVSLAAGVGFGRGRHDLTLASAPPVVVKTVPEAGATGVDPKTAELRVTFSKGMMDGGWSWVSLSESSFPKMPGAPRYEKDKRTCVLPVSLEPGRTYSLWVNSPKFDNFKDADGRPAVPYLLVFETRP
jgi:RNA polymerase sigma-70 factor (ECF subfamily)